MEPLEALVVFANFVVLPAATYGAQLALGAPAKEQGADADA